MLLPLKTPFIISCIAGGIGGAFYGHFNFRKFIMGGMGIFELPNMMNPDGSMGNIIVALVGIAISMVVGFALTMVFYKEPEEKAEEPKSVLTTVRKHEKTSIVSPLIDNRAFVVGSDVKEVPGERCSEQTKKQRMNRNDRVGKICERTFYGAVQQLPTNVKVVGKRVVVARQSWM